MGTVKFNINIEDIIKTSGGRQILQNKIAMLKSMLQLVNLLPELVTRKGNNSVSK